MDKDLELLLSSAIAKDDAQEQSARNAKKLRLTRGCYEKIMLYAALTSRITNIGMECYGYLLREKWKTDELITNMYFADDQLVSSAYVQVTVEGIRKAMQEVSRRGCEIVGWWHSHGSFNVFHSGTDVKNFESVLHGISPDTIFSYQKAPYLVDEQQKAVVYGDLALTGLTPEELAIFQKRNIPSFRKVQKEPYAFSLVVNNNRDTYRERITKTIQPSGEFRVNAPIYPTLEIVDVPNDLEFLV